MPSPPSASASAPAPASAGQAALASAWKVIPGLQSRDIAATARFYTEELHFNLGGVYCADSDSEVPGPGQQLTFCSVYVGDKAVVNIYLGLCDAYNKNKSGGGGGAASSSDDDADHGQEDQDKGKGKKEEEMKKKEKEVDSFVPGWVLVAMGTKQLDEYYDALVATGRVEVVEKIGDRPWGYRQFSVRDGDGNKLTFFRFLEGGNPGGGEDDEEDLSARR